MPTYQYSCTGCGEQLEVVQSFSDPALTVCPACQGKLRKVFNSVGIVFKGSGFYRTDSRSSGKSGGASKPAEPKSESSKSEASKSESSSSAAKTSDSSSSSSSTTKSTAPAASSS